LKAEADCFSLFVMEMDVLIRDMGGMLVDNKVKSFNRGLESESLRNPN
jgi:hypothetical protein